MEEDPLIALKNALKSSQSNTSNILHRLHKIEDRLVNIEKKMKPIQETTENYSRAKDNINLTLLEVEKTYEYFRISFDAKEIIQNGLNMKTANKYFDILNKLSSAKFFFETHTEIKSSASVLSNIKNLIKTALSSCETELDKLLTQCGSMIEISEGNFNVVNTSSTSNLVNDIKIICSNLEIHKHRAHLESYQRIRILQIKSDLSKYESSRAGDWSNLKKDVPYQKGSHPFKDYYNYAFELLRGELQLWSSILPSNVDTISSYINICEATILYVQQIILNFTIEKKAKDQSGYIALKQINGFLIQLEMLEIFMSKYDEIRDICRIDNNQENKASQAVTNTRNKLIVSIISNIAILFDITSDVHQITNSSIIHSKESSPNNDDSCDLYPITGNILHCCKEINNFVAVYKQSIDIANELEIKVPSTAQLLSDFIFNLINNLFQCLQAKADLFDRNLPKLSSKRSYDSKSHALYDHDNKESDIMILHAKKYLFLCNNLYSLYIYLYDKQKELQSIVESTNRNLNNSVVIINNRKSVNSIGSNNLTSIQYYKQIVALSEAIEEKLDHAEKDFCNVILIVLGLDTNSMSEFLDQHNKDKSGKYRILKSKFMMFNGGMESLLSKQGEWRIPSSVLRDKITNLLVDNIISVYAEFYNKYSVIKFSKKHLNLYLKHSPADVDRLIRSFFGRTS